MSQHIKRVSVEGKPATLVIGWDRPLQGYHLTIMLDAGKRDGKCVYSNLEDDELSKKYPQCRGLAPSLDDFKPVLHRLQIELPAVMFEQAQLDQVVNAGNRVVSYDNEEELPQELDS
jgi:hypothetical protein